MKIKLSRKEAEEEIKKLFSKDSSPKQIKKAKKLAMNKNIKLKDLRKKFCKKCYSLFNPKNHEVRIKNKMKTIKCKNCKDISRYNIKNH